MISLSLHQWVFILTADVGMNHSSKKRNQAGSGGGNAECAPNAPHSQVGHPFTYLLPLRDKEVLQWCNVGV